MTTKIEYQSIDLLTEVRVYTGRHKTSDVYATGDVRITRVVDGGTDTFFVTGPGIVEGVEIPSHAVAAGVRRKVVAVAKTKLPAKDGD